MKITTERGITVLTPNGSTIHFDRAVNDDLCETLEEICDRKEKPRIIVDMTNVTELHADALGQLMVMYAETKSAGGYFALCAVTDGVARYLATMKADLIFRFFPSLDHVHSAFDRLADATAVPR